MKKPYSQPDILFESFTLNSSIAAGCEAKPDTNNEGCGIQFGRQIIFTENASDNCTRTAEGTEYNQYCYHTFDEAFNIFFS